MVSTNIRNDVLFAYSCTPSYGWTEKDDGGFSLEIHSNGLMMYKTYLFDMIVQSSKDILLSSNTINHIQYILKKNKIKINSIKSSLDNGSLDGCMNRFQFLEKEVIAWNIVRINTLLLLLIDRKYFIEFKENIKHENNVIGLFNKIAKVLENDGVILTLDNIEFSRYT